MYIFVPLFNYEFPVRSARRRRQNLWNVCHKNFAKNASDAYRGFFRPALKSEKFVMPAGSPLALTHTQRETLFSHGSVNKKKIWRKYDK